MNKSEYKRPARNGPGGRSCSCCFPQYGKGRRRARHQDEVRTRRHFTRLLEEGLSES
jgi:hypothetical protein